MTSIYAERKPSDRARWICIYPAYLNNKKTLAEGRIVPKKFAVENPTYQEILEVVKASGFNAEVENKQYSRECSKEWLFRGRIRVQLKNDDGTPVNQTFPSMMGKNAFISSELDMNAFNFQEMNYLSSFFMGVNVFGLFIDKFAFIVISLVISYN